MYRSTGRCTQAYALGLDIAIGVPEGEAALRRRQVGQSDGRREVMRGRGDTKPEARSRWARWVPRPGRVRNHWSLRPFRRWLRHRSLWSLEQRPVARGVAIGLFFGILLPVAQILLAAVAAVLLRANLAVAAVSTLVTNPLTFPFVYYLAYRVGSFLTGGRGSGADVARSQEAASHATDVGGWASALGNWVTSIGVPLAVGVVTLATAASLLGYLLVHAIWRWRDARRRRAQRSPASGA